MLHRINALVEQEVKRRMFEEKVHRESWRKQEREKEKKGEKPGDSEAEGAAQSRNPKPQGKVREGKARVSTSGERRSGKKFS